MPNRMKELRTQRRDIITKLNDIATQRQGMLDSLWILESQTTHLRSDLSAVLGEIDRLADGGAR